MLYLRRLTLLTLIFAKRCHADGNVRMEDSRLAYFWNGKTGATGVEYAQRGTFSRSICGSAGTMTFRNPGDGVSLVYTGADWNLDVVLGKDQNLTMQVYFDGAEVTTISGYDPSENVADCSSRAVEDDWNQGIPYGRHNLTLIVDTSITLTGSITIQQMGYIPFDPLRPVIPVGPIVGGVMGFLVVLGVVLFFFYRRRRRQRSQALRAASQNRYAFALNPGHQQGDPVI